MNYPYYFTDMPILRSQPTLVVRVISGYVWDSIIFPQLQQYSQGLVPPPKLGPPSVRGIYITDPQSLAVCNSAEDFALRLSLRLSFPRPHQNVALLDPLQEIRLHGCALIYFSLPSSTQVDVLQPISVHGITPSSPGLTLGGAREWILRDNPNLVLSDMEVFFINPSGSRWGPIRL